MTAENDSTSTESETSLTTYVINFSLICVIIYLLWKIFKTQTEVQKPVTVQQIPRMKKRDFTLEELKEYDGVKGDGRVLMAINGNVYDVTKGKNFYGPGGPYAVFAGRDASRGLATFCLDNPKEGFDDLSDLRQDEMDSVREWELQFKEKYEFVGRLLRPGDSHNTYSDDEEGAEKSKDEDSTEKSKDE